jgi:uncharacterized protein (DUF924 family)
LWNNSGHTIFVNNRRQYLCGAGFMPVASPHDVLTFWFAPGQSDRWYAKDEALDTEIRQRFLPTYEAACSGHLDAWREHPDSLLAMIIVLDQFPRNMFRGSARAFAFDAQAARFTREGIERGFGDVLSEAQLDFFYMPLMHSESLSDHDLLRERGRDNDRYALEHREIIVRFGRYPHRNAVLGRDSTPEEASYLAGPHASF